MFGGGRRDFRTISMFPGRPVPLEAAEICAHKPLGCFGRFIPCSGSCSLALGEIFAWYQIPPPLKCSGWEYWENGGVVLFCKWNVPVLGQPGFESLIHGFLGTVHARSGDTESLIHTMALLSFQTISSNSQHLIRSLFFFPHQKQRRRRWRGVRHMKLGVPPWNLNVPSCPQPTPTCPCTPRATPGWILPHLPRSPFCRREQGSVPWVAEGQGRAAGNTGLDAPKKPVKISGEGAANTAAQEQACVWTFTGEKGHIFLFCSLFRTA